PVVRSFGHSRGTIAPGADRRRRPQRPVPSARPRRPVACPDDPRRAGDRPPDRRCPSQPARGAQGLGSGTHDDARLMAEDRSTRSDASRWCLPAVVLAAVVGLGLLADTARSISATYDEVAYLRVASVWWRTGRQAEITRMGSPLTFWKVQQAPVLWLLDRVG